MANPQDYIVQPVNALGAYLGGVQAKQQQVEGQERNALLKMQQQYTQQQQAALGQNQQRAATKDEQDQQRALIEDLAKVAPWYAQAQTPEDQAQRREAVLANYASIFGEEKVAPFRDPARFESALAWAKTEQAKFGQPVAGVGADGKPQFRQFSPDGQSQPVEGFSPAPRGKGISTTLPDGTVIEIGGDGSPSAAPTKATETNLQQGLVDTRANLDRLNGIMSQYKPEYSTYAAQAESWATNQAQKLGLEVDPKRVEAMQGFTAWKADTLDNTNRAIKEMTGASMGVQEAGRIIGSLPSVDDGPGAFQAKMKSVIRRLNMSEARLAYSLKHGLKLDPKNPDQTISLDKMTAIYNKRGDEIAAELRKADPQMKPDQLNAAVRQALEAEFRQ